MKRLAIAVAVIALATGCTKAEQQSAEQQTSDSAHMMMEMTDSSAMMARDTATK